MIWWDVLLLPLLLGLLGFFEPCSLGVNAIFLAHIRRLELAKRIGETTIFALMRALILSLVGLAVVFIGRNLFVFQRSYFIFLGGFYTLLGAFSIWSKHSGASLPMPGLAGRIKKGNLLSMAVVFGIVIPACAIPLLLALLGRTLLLGEYVSGWASLFIFGLALSLPLVFISSSQRADRVIQRMHARVSRWPYLTGIVLIVLGIITAWSSVWWANPIA